MLHRKVIAILFEIHTKQINKLLRVIVWVVPRCVVFNSRRRRVDIHSPMKMETTQCSETSAIKHHKRGNSPKGYTQHSEHGESLE
jgi:hypothetical protein